MDTKFKVVFDYDGKGPKFFEKSVIEKAFIDCYNWWCDHVNPQLDTWNDEYTGPCDGGDPGSKYDAFIRNKAAAFIWPINELLMKVRNKTSLEGFFLDEHCNFKGSLGKRGTMGIHLEKY